MKLIVAVSAICSNARRWSTPVPLMVMLLATALTPDLFKRSTPPLTVVSPVYSLASNPVRSSVPAVTFNGPLPLMRPEYCHRRTS